MTIISPANAGAANMKSAAEAAVKKRVFVIVLSLVDLN
ncbi:hypothetical protein Z950_2457 [Sulfitobacter mediterraneus KCTC 32188]|nr:hypothetical protein Z950_2457 [Sulfitobacter mediterraneus KCTC 32188]